MSEKTDAMVLQLFNKVKEKKKEIERAEKPRWETNATIGYNPDIVTDRINIQTVSDIKKLVDMYGFLLTKEAAWKDACEDLEVTIPFSWMGFSVGQWEKDFRARLSQINITTKKKELDALERRLDALVTVEQRRELELAEISKILEE